MPFGTLVIYTSSQKGSAKFDKQLNEKFGARVIRDRAKILLPTPRITKRAIKILENEGITRVWFGAAAPLALMASALRKNGVSNIVALSHGHEVWWAKIPIFKQLLRKIIKDIDYLGYLGNFTKNEIIKVSSEPNKLIQIAPGIDTNHFMPRTASAKLIAKYRLEDRRIIICVARLVHRKGQDQLIQAMPKILESHPDAILLLVGVGPIKQMLENSARQLRITHKIVFAGRVSHDELPDYLAISEIFAMPVRSRFSGLEVEGLGIVYLEASACAKPVVVGNSGGAADAVIDGVTGLLVDSSKVDEISNAICKLLDDPIKGKQMGEAGRDWVLANWQMSNWSKKFNKLLLDN
jgi:phosphatidylinositol alpha-1,6-mannosyltransferase